MENAMPDSQIAAPPAKSPRIAFIDLLRGWAVIVMIETHVFNATLLPALRETDLFHVLRFVNGLVAPSFLFASGMAFAVTARRKLPEYLAGRPALFRQLLRLLLVLLIGYTLHIPKFSLAHLLHVAGDEAWRTCAQVDVLHCIAVSLLLLLAMLLLFRTEARTYLAAAVLIPLIAVVTPMVWASETVRALPLPLGAYLTNAYRSMFPLFPWTAFLLSGALTGYLYLEAKDRMVRRLLIGGGVAIAGSLLLLPVAEAAYPVFDFWRSSPNFFFLRLGIVLLLCAGMLLYEQSRGVSTASAVTLIGRESLIVYVAHLTLIYGDVGTFNFRKWVDSTFGYAEALGVTIALLAAMYLLARAWSAVKRGPSRRKAIVEWSFVALLVAVFFLTPA
jgi:uncharacterized membrane protein